MKKFSFAVFAIFFLVDSSRAQGRWFCSSPLPPEFRSDEIKEVYEELFEVGPKGEFETSREYSDRTRQFVQKTLIFVVSEETVDTQYDADSGVFSIIVDTERPAGGSDAYVVMQDQIKTRDYSATNAFGVQKNVQEFRKRVYGIVTSEAAYSAEARARFNFQISREKAVAAEKHLQVYIVMRPDPLHLPKPLTPQLTHRRTANYFDYESPTIDSPIERTTFYHLLAPSEIGILAVNDQTREVLFRDAGADKMCQKLMLEPL